MKKKILIFLTLTGATSAVFWGGLFNFFAQDDFILINYFSRNNLFVDFGNVFSFHSVTHWRPIHSLYFLATGNFFDKYYLGYHLITFGVHIISGFLIFKTVEYLSNNRIISLVSALLYVAHPAHFVSLFWIAGNATTIGFTLLIASFYCRLLKKNNLSLVLFSLSLLTSEAMIVGLVVFGVYEFFTKKTRGFQSYLLKMALLASVFSTLKMITLISQNTFSSYKVQLSGKVMIALKYYLLRVAGFGESGEDLIISILLLAWLVVVAFLLIKKVFQKDVDPVMKFAMATVILGLFPFIFIPEHLSAHYINISLWGFSMIVATALSSLKTSKVIAIFLVFFLLSIYTVNILGQLHWTTRRGRLAKAYIDRITMENLAPGSIIIFDEKNLSTSEEAYITLGGGQAINFWFNDKNYRACFTRFEKCPSLP